MNLGQTAGLLLILAGIAWFFLAEYGTRRRRSRGAAGPTGFFEKLLEWASKNLPRKFLPGVFLIVIGAFLLLSTGDSDDNPPSTTTTTSVPATN